MTKRTEGDNSDLVYDPEIERSIRLWFAEKRRQRQEDMADQRPNNDDVNNEQADPIVNPPPQPINPVVPARNAVHGVIEPPNQPLRETMGNLMMPNLGIAPSAIVLNPIARSYVLKQCHLAVLPSFSGTSSEGAVEFIMEYGHAVRSLPLGALTETDLMLRCFPYVLKGKAKTWFLGLQPNSITTWQQLHDEFHSTFRWST